MILNSGDVFRRFCVLEKVGEGVHKRIYPRFAALRAPSSGTTFLRLRSRMRCRERSKVEVDKAGID